MTEPKVKKGTPSPYKPVTPEQIAHFAAQWADAALTVEGLARRYRVNARTINKWVAEFGLGDRDKVLAAQAQARSVLGAAADAIQAVKGAASLVPATIAAQQPVTPQIVDPARFDPLQDQEIAQAMAEIKAMVASVTPHSDLTALQRKLSALSVQIAMKMPAYNWASLQVTVEALSRSLLNQRRVEAEIPQSHGDPVLLRKEAAAQMMKELKSALSPEDQQALAVLVKRGADALMRKQQPGGGS